jgi:hypothetical protein
VFRMRARNIYGEGAYSYIGGFHQATIPVSPSISVSEDGIKVDIGWDDSN